MLRWRLLLGTLLIAALIGLFWLDHAAAVPGVWLAPVLAVAAILGTQELVALCRAAGMNPAAWAVYAGNAVILAGPWAAAVCPAAPACCGGACAGGIQWSLAALAAAVLLVIVAELARYRQPGEATRGLAAGMLGLTYVGLLLSFAVHLRLQFGVGALAATLIVVKMSDTGAYFTGRLLGRHKMAPRISPGKTIEGGLGGLVWAAASSWATFRWLVPLCTPPHAAMPSGLGWLVFAVVVSLAGIIGDLSESLLKRDVGRKDSSTWLPGFGGALDMLDSVLAAAPAAYACWALGLV